MQLVPLRRGTQRLTSRGPIARPRFDTIPIDTTAAAGRVILRGRLLKNKRRRSSWWGGRGWVRHFSTYWPGIFVIIIAKLCRFHTNSKLRRDPFYRSCRVVGTLRGGGDGGVQVVHGGGGRRCQQLRREKNKEGGGSNEGNPTNTTRRTISP